METKIEDRDKVDEIDDPFDLYSQDIEPIKEEELTPEKIKEIIKEEKTKVKRNSFKNTLFSAGGFVSIYRLLGYGILIFGFFALNNNNLFLPIPFLIGLGIVPIAVLLTKLVIKSEVSQ
jgi:cytochrome c biogenesis protein CcdA